MTLTISLFKGNPETPIHIKYLHTTWSLQTPHMQNRDVIGGVGLISSDPTEFESTRI